jgi:hypothetical protein
MGKALYVCDNCGRAVTKQVRKMGRQKHMYVVFGACANFECDHCSEPLIMGYSQKKNDFIVMTQKRVNEAQDEQRMEAFDPCI